MTKNNFLKNEYTEFLLLVFVRSDGKKWNKGVKGYDQF